MGVRITIGIKLRRKEARIKRKITRGRARTIKDSNNNKIMLK